LVTRHAAQELKNLKSSQRCRLKLLYERGSMSTEASMSL
jgi:hypothetical protein